MKRKFTVTLGRLTLAPLLLCWTAETIAQDDAVPVTVAEVEEIVEIFKWTRAQRRRLPDKSGFKLEVKGRRPWDNYFWFYHLHGYPEEFTTWPQLWKQPKDSDNNCWLIRLMIYARLSVSCKAIWRPCSMAFFP